MNRILEVNGAGPFVDGIFSQSNYGIVTKMGFWLIPEPEASISGRIRVPRHDDVIPLVRILANLTYSGLVNCNFMVTSPIFLGPEDAEKSTLLDQPGGSAVRAGRTRVFAPIRTELTPEVVAVFVRQGNGAMPFFRPTELNDADLKALGAYLAHKRP